MLPRSEALYFSIRRACHDHRRWCLEHRNRVYTPSTWSRCVRGERRISRYTVRLDSGGCGRGVVNPRVWKSLHVLKRFTSAFRDWVVGNFLGSAGDGGGPRTVEVGCPCYCVFGAIGEGRIGGFGKSGDMVLSYVIEYHGQDFCR